MDENTPIDVNGDLTPITKQKIKQIRSDLWHSPDISTEFLLDQRDILQSRLEAICSTNQSTPQMIINLQSGIKVLDGLITVSEAKRDPNLR